MRKAFAYVIALGTFTFIAVPALAENVDIGGTHSAQEIKTTCKKAGGTFSGVDKDLGTYGCHKGGNIVSCSKDGKCVGCTNCTGTSKQAAGGTTDKRTIGGVLTNAPVKNVQPLRPQKTTRSPATGATQPLTQQKTARSPRTASTQPLTQQKTTGSAGAIRRSR
jgi:hypothetical protein